MGRKQSGGLIWRRWHGARSVLRVTGEDEQDKVRGWRAGRETHVHDTQRKKEMHRTLIIAERRRLTSPDILTGRKVSIRGAGLTKRANTTGPAVTWQNVAREEQN